MGKSAQKQRKRPKTILTIVEGGERTYIHPFSYYDFDYPSNNDILLLETPEFEVDQTWHPTDLMKWEASDMIIATVRRFWRTLEKCSFWRLLDFKREWENIRPVVGADIYRGSTITVDGTLTPSMAGSKWTDTSYLIPSQEWLAQKLQEWTFQKRPESDINYTVGGIDYHDYERNSYLTWAQKQIELGRKIGFFSSLDT